MLDTWHKLYFFTLHLFFIFPTSFLTKSLPDTMAQLTLDENEDEEGVAATKELPEYACR